MNNVPPYVWAILFGMSVILSYVSNEGEKPTTTLGTLTLFLAKIVVFFSILVLFTAMFYAAE